MICRVCGGAGDGADDPGAVVSSGYVGTMSARTFSVVVEVNFDALVELSARDMDPRDAVAAELEGALGAVRFEMESWVEAEMIARRLI